MLKTLSAMEPTQSQTHNLFITFVDKEGPFLKIWGQTDKHSSIYVEQILLSASPQFDQGIGRIPFEKLQVGTLVCAKYKDDKYYRARIIGINNLTPLFVEVNFVDYGNKDVVPSENIRTLQNFPTSFISIAPLAIPFIFAEAHCAGGGEWKDQVLQQISKDLRYREVQCHILTQAIQYYLVKLFIEATDIGALLITKGFLQPIPLLAQQAVLLNMSLVRNTSAAAAAAPAPPPSAPAPSSTTINTYKACTLEPMQQYAVYVSFVNDGPTHFSVQLQQFENQLAILMKEINEIDLTPLEDMPLPGTICLARCQEDQNICRAVVTNGVDNQFKVFYVDFGNYETLPLEHLFQIPFKYVLPKVMAIRLSLNGVEKTTVTIEMLLAFKKFVDNRLLHMRVLPSPKKNMIPKCELWDPETKTSAVDVINRAAQHAYPEPLLLNRGFSQSVKVSYVFSCSKFFVQLASKESELAKLMEDLQISCPNSDAVDEIKLGLPCCALFEADQLWYRSQIAEVVDKDTVKVKYIDYGNEEVVPVYNLRQVEGELLTVLRPQAIECCLNGYQNMEADETRDNLLEELILEQTFTMKVSEMLGKKALVELINSESYNVASLLLDKIAAAQSQVGPMLVQAGNKIEHRKSGSMEGHEGFRGPRKPARDQNKECNNQNDRSENRNFGKSNDKPWRNNNKEYRQNDNNIDESSPDNGSWRQNNKGFNRGNKNDRFDRNDRNDRPSVNDRFNRNHNAGGDNNWNNKNSTQTEEWDSPGNDTSNVVVNDTWEVSISPVQNNFESRNFRDNNFGRKRFDEGRGERNNDRGKFNKDGYRKDNVKRDFKKDGSEFSSSGSEHSFKKGPRTSSRNDRNGGSRFQPRSHNSFNNETWSVSDVSTPIDAAPSTATFETVEVVGTEASIVISWFHDPEHFYCQLQSVQDEFKKLMEDIQHFYKNRKPESCPVGSPCVGLFPEDNVLYRAQILENYSNQYKVLYVDFGNVTTITRVWPLEKKFLTMPAQAIRCGLSGIAPNGENWANPSAYAKFFNKNSYMARFLEKDDTRNLVELWDGQEEISQLMVQENLALAKAKQDDSNNVEISILLNQQFRVVLLSVNNLSDVVVALESGVALNCKAHNLDTAEETFEDVLKGYLNQFIILYVDNILENDVLDVTFYDNDGNKLEVLKPDPGAFDTVETLCPILLTNSFIVGFVCHATETSIFVHPRQYADQLAILLQNMFDAYEGVEHENTIIPEEGLVYAVHSEDGNWYRGRVLTFDDDKANVLYLDYGNGEDVAFSALRELKPEFNVPHMLCLQVHPSNGAPLEYLEKEIVVSVYYGEKGWEGAVEEYKQTGEAEQALQVNEAGTQAEYLPETVAQEQAIQKEDNQIPCEPQEAGLIQETAEVAEPLPVVSQGTPVVISHIDSPTQFYVQFSESVAALTELQEKLQETVAELPALENISVGVLCAAPYSVDQQWYRAEVLDADDDITTVRFVDYGNTDVIDNKSTQIKTLPPNLLSLAVYAARCSLKLKAVDDEWSQQALVLFEELAYKENVSADFIIQDEKTHIVELYSNGQNVKDVLLESGFAVPCEIVAESKTTCFISHLNSPSEFWVQLENCIDELEWIAEQLSGAENFREVEDLSPGTLCAALFPDDEMWYRARILSNTVAGIELLFIDYGNSSISNSFRQLPEDLVVTQPLAQKCCLQKPKGIPYWTKEAQNKFAELSAEGQTIFEIKKLSTGETATVELLLNGESIVPMILPSTEDGYIRNYQSLTLFSIEKNGEIMEEFFRLEPMPGMMWDQDSHDDFWELYPEGTLLQIEFINKQIEFMCGVVRLYKDGVDIRPQLGGVKCNLNLSASQLDKTEQVEVSEEYVIEHETGGNINSGDSAEALKEEDNEIKTNTICDTIKEPEHGENENPPVPEASQIAQNENASKDTEVSNTTEGFDQTENTNLPLQELGNVENKDLPVPEATEIASDASKDTESSNTPEEANQAENKNLPVLEATETASDASKDKEICNTPEEAKQDENKILPVLEATETASDASKDAEICNTPEEANQDENKPVIEATETASDANKETEIANTSEEAKQDENKVLPVLESTETASDTSKGTEVSNTPEEAKQAENKNLPVLEATETASDASKDTEEANQAKNKNLPVPEATEISSDAQDTIASNDTPKETIDDKNLKKEVCDTVKDPKLGENQNSTVNETTEKLPVVVKIDDSEKSDKLLASETIKAVPDIVEDKNASKSSEVDSGHHSELERDESSKGEEKQIVEDLEPPVIRPGSADSGGRISHDDRIVPGALSRPHSPLPEDSDNGN